MANFIPFKLYILSVLDELIQKYNISSPFLDVGCGKGDVALHLAKKGWRGDAIDITPQSVETTRKLLKPYPKVSVSQTTIGETPNKKYNLIIFLDVLEHIPDDHSALKAAARMELPGAYLIITVPSNPDREWRWDDEVYGHLRRYKPGDIEKLISNSGFHVVEMWDISNPIFWLFRRAFTAMKVQPTIVGSQLQRSQQSPYTNAWNLGWISDLLSNTHIWKPAYRIQKRYRDNLEKGNELAILAQRN